MAYFSGVLLDWVGTLVVPNWGPAVGARPRGARWIEGALAALGREATPAEVALVSAALDGAGARPDVRARWTGADLSAEAFREKFGFWVGGAGLDADLVDALHEGMSTPTNAEFAVDTEPTLAALKAAGLKIAIVSDVHVDIRPAFVKAGLDAYVDEYVLPFERGACKPDPAMFHAALTGLGLSPDEALMVGDRSAYDGGGVEAGLTTLLLPPLAHPGRRRLHLVLATCGVPEVRPVQASAS
jgi:HAD superfamily hydrolase (TIGR01509 family)